MELIEVNSAEEVIEYLRPSDPRWRSGHVVNPLTTSWFFRGQSDAKWGLTPSRFRDVPVKCTSTKMSLVKNWTTMNRERQDILAFLTIADEHGLLTYLPFQAKGEVNAFFGKILDFQGGNLTNLESTFSEAILQAYALAQHHGIETRLLDWTASPLCALFFAARDTLFSPRGQSHFSVWAISQGAVSLRGHRIRFVSPPKTGNEYLRAQKGTFTFDPFADQYFDENDGWPPQDRIIEDHNDIVHHSTSLLRKIVIPQSEARQTLILLRHEGISHVSLMPTLDNAAITVEENLALYKAEYFAVSKK